MTLWLFILIMIKVIIDSPVNNSSIIYKSKYYCIDPMILLDAGKKTIGWLRSTEYEKAKKYSSLDEIRDLNKELKELNEAKKYKPLMSSLVIDWLLENDEYEILVPESFPTLESDNIRKHNINVIPIQEPFYNEKVIKTKEEIEYIRDNSILNDKVMKEVHDIIAESSILNDKKLNYKGQVLTSEYLQEYILKSFIEKGLFNDFVIVSVGDQGCDPHEFGYGPIIANTSIIVDIFPKNRKNHYCTDMTRTFCKGKASDELKSIYNAVLEAQKIGLAKVHAREDGKSIHKKIQKYFIDNGFKSGIINGVLQGFFHGTGHGVGLDFHESPYISENGTILPENSIVTVEPGLYYLGKGSVRIEDIVLVTNDGIENFNNFDKNLEIE